MKEEVKESPFPTLIPELFCRHTSYTRGILKEPGFKSITDKSGWRGGWCGAYECNAHKSVRWREKNDYECALAEHVKGTKSLFRNLLRIEF